MMKRINVFFIVLVLNLVIVHAALAFSDVTSSKYGKEIKALQEEKIINGVGNDHFLPDKSLTYAEGVQLITKAFDLNLAHFTFIKQPEPSDYFDHIEDGKWYSEAFVHAHLNNVPIEKGVKANAPLTREEFAHILMEAISQKGDYMFIELWKTIEDEQQINQEYMSSIQKLLITNMVQLEDESFYPKEEIKRETAAKWVYEGLQFVRSNENTGNVDPLK